MPTLSYLHYDVFTDRPLSGNQLAVLPDAQALATADMQAIAREMNFSESAFILPAERDATDVRMRIFTPHVEMPMAGHPTIGATFALAQGGRSHPFARVSCSASTSDRPPWTSNGATGIWRLPG